MYVVAYKQSLGGKKVLLLGLDADQLKVTKKIALHHLGDEAMYAGGDELEYEMAKVHKTLSELVEIGSLIFIPIRDKIGFGELHRIIANEIANAKFDVVVIDNHKVIRDDSINFIESFADKIREIYKVDVRHPNEMRYDDIDELKELFK